MIKKGLWKGKLRRHVRHHQQRARRPCIGELVQIDGSPHDWFEGRGERCCLLVFIDDASGQLLQLHFTPEESTRSYFEATQNYIKQHGRPVAFYSDRHSIFRVNTLEAKKSTGETQLGRALRELDIDLICAHSPQAKGRVERANQTLQDRLIKEMRLKNINTIDTANAYVQTFMADYNQRFAVTPASPINAHRQPIPPQAILDLIFSVQSTRTISKNLEVSYKQLLYQIQTTSPSYSMQNAKLTVCERNNAVTLIYKRKKLDYIIFDKHNRPTPIVHSKQINKIINSKIQHKLNHPWRSSYLLQPRLNSTAQQ
jgi:hypothetical protein